MQGLSPEGYEPLPPNSSKEIYREEVENCSDAGSTTTPLLENTKITLVQRLIFESSCVGSSYQTTSCSIGLIW